MTSQLCTILTREGLYPAWADLSARIARATKAFRESDGGAEAEAKCDAELRALGCDWLGRRWEISNNRPPPK